MDRLSCRPYRINILVIEADGLVGKDGSCDPYCVVRIKDQLDSTRTLTIQRCVEPEWDESLELFCNDFTTVVILSILDEVDDDIDDMLGEVSIPLKGLGLDMPLDSWLDLKGGSLGDDVGRLHVTIAVAHNPAYVSYLENQKAIADSAAVKTTSRRDPNSKLLLSLVPPLVESELTETKPLWEEVFHCALPFVGDEGDLDTSMSSRWDRSILTTAFLPHVDTESEEESRISPDTFSTALHRCSNLPSPVFSASLQRLIDLGLPGTLQLHLRCARRLPVTADSAPDTGAYCVAVVNGLESTRRATVPAPAGSDPDWPTGHFCVPLLGVRRPCLQLLLFEASRGGDNRLLGTADLPLATAIASADAGRPTSEWLSVTPADEAGSFLGRLLGKLPTDPTKSKRHETTKSSADSEIPSANSSLFVGKSVRSRRRRLSAETVNTDISSKQTKATSVFRRLVRNHAIDPEQPNSIGESSPEVTTDAVLSKLGDRPQPPGSSDDAFSVNIDTLSPLPPLPNGSFAAVAVTLCFHATQTSVNSLLRSASDTEALYDALLSGMLLYDLRHASPYVPYKGLGDGSLDLLQDFASVYGLSFHTGSKARASLLYLEKLVSCLKHGVPVRFSVIYRLWKELRELINNGDGAGNDQSRFGAVTSKCIPCLRSALSNCRDHRDDFHALVPLFVSVVDYDAESLGNISMARKELERLVRTPLTSFQSPTANKEIVSATSKAGTKESSGAALELLLEWSEVLIDETPSDLDAFMMAGEVQLGMKMASLAFTRLMDCVALSVKQLLPEQTVCDNRVFTLHSQLLALRGCMEDSVAVLEGHVAAEELDKWAGGLMSTTAIRAIFTPFVLAWIKARAAQFLDWEEAAFLQDKQNGFVKMSDMVWQSSSTYDVCKFCYESTSLLIDLLPSDDMLLEFVQALCGVTQLHVRKIADACVEYLLEWSTADDRRSADAMPKLLLSESLCVRLNDISYANSNLSDLLDVLEQHLGVVRQHNSVVVTRRFVKKQLVSLLESVVAMLNRFLSGAVRKFASTKVSVFDVDAVWAPVFAFIDQELSIPAEALAPHTFQSLLRKVFHIVLVDLEHVLLPNVTLDKTAVALNAAQRDAIRISLTEQHLLSYFSDGLSAPLLVASTVRLCNILGAHDQSTPALIRLHTQLCQPVSVDSLRRTCSGGAGRRFDTDVTADDVLLILAGRVGDQDAAERVEQFKHTMGDNAVRRRFLLPADEKILDTFTYTTSNLLRGVLYVTSAHVCFDTLQFAGTTHMQAIPLTSVEAVRKTRGWGKITSKNLELTTVNNGATATFYHCSRRGEAIEAIKVAAAELGQYVCVHKEASDTNKWYLAKFELSDDQVLLRKFACTLLRGGLLDVPGFVFCFKEAIAFYSSLAGVEAVRVLPFAAVISVEKAKTSLIGLDSAIEIMSVREDKANTKPKRTLLSHFTRRDRALETITQLWTQSKQPVDLVRVFHDATRQSFTTLKLTATTSVDDVIEMYLEKHKDITSGDLVAHTAGSDRILSSSDGTPLSLVKTWKEQGRTDCSLVFRATASEGGSSLLAPKGMVRLFRPDGTYLTLKATRDSPTSSLLVQARGRRSSVAAASLGASGSSGVERVSIWMLSSSGPRKLEATEQPVALLEDASKDGSECRLELRPDSDSGVVRLFRADGTYLTVKMPLEGTTSSLLAQVRGRRSSVAAFPTAVTATAAIAEAFSVWLLCADSGPRKLEAHEQPVLLLEQAKMREGEECRLELRSDCETPGVVRLFRPEGTYLTLKMSSQGTTQTLLSLASGRRSSIAPGAGAPEKMSVWMLGGPAGLRRLEPTEQPVVLLEQALLEGRECRLELRSD